MLVMSSALGTSQAMWDAQRPLAARYSLLLYDHRGLGASPAPPGPYSIEDLGGDVIALLDKFGAGAVSFCGVSLGGMVGMWLAAHHRERIRSLVVMCALSRLQPASTVSPSAPPRSERRHRADCIRRCGPLVHASASQREHPATVAGFTAALAGHDRGRLRKLLRSDRDLRPAHRYSSEIDAPTLIIAGAEDPIVPSSSAVMFGASFRDASVAVGSGCGAPGERRAAGDRESAGARASDEPARRSA